MASLDQYKKNLLTVFAGIEDKKLMKAFLDDVFTPAELEDVAKRLELVRLLQRGTPQRDIAKTLNISIAKVTRGSHVLKKKNSGLRAVLNKFFPSSYDTHL